MRILAFQKCAGIWSTLWACYSSLPVSLSCFLKSSWASWEVNTAVFWCSLSRHHLCIDRFLLITGVMSGYRSAVKGGIVNNEHCVCVFVCVWCVSISHWATHCRQSHCHRTASFTWSWVHVSVSSGVTVSVFSDYAVDCRVVSALQCDGMRREWDGGGMRQRRLRERTTRLLWGLRGESKRLLWVVVVPFAGCCEVTCRESVSWLIIWIKLKEQPDQTLPTTPIQLRPKLLLY